MQPKANIFICWDICQCFIRMNKLYTLIPYIDLCHAIISQIPTKSECKIFVMAKGKSKKYLEHSGADFR